MTQSQPTQHWTDKVKDLAKVVLRKLNRTPAERVEDFTDEIADAIQHLERCRIGHLQMAETYAQSIHKIKSLSHAVGERVPKPQPFAVSSWPNLDEQPTSMKVRAQR